MTMHVGTKIAVFFSRMRLLNEIPRYYIYFYIDKSLQKIVDNKFVFVLASKKYQFSNFNLVIAVLKKRVYPNRLNTIFHAALCSIFLNLSAIGFGTYNRLRPSFLLL